ncbi:superoxide dismutase [Cu-Zn]-like [Panulirus ornatus]|uniref:superoxide dismutase [Cu-Zn]-like n=1 Tax=Panulirus ornatus TaxID=150431 RepID=UPI003A84F875
MKCVVYVLAAILFMGAGALIAGLSVYYTTETSYKVSRAKCVLTPSSADAKINGTIFFSQKTEKSEVLVTGNITGLAVGMHGFHVHKYGVTGGQCTAALGHYNPDNYNHGGRNSHERHVGDLGNIESVSDGSGTGTAIVHITDRVISLSGPRSIVGRSIVVHEKKDDLGLGGDQGSVTTGNAGARLACCTIYIFP